MKCDEGYLHRPTPVTCSGALAEGGQGGGASELPRADGTVVCDDDESACDAFYLGICRPETLPGTGGAGPSHCISGCASDLDCGDNGFCVCSDDGPGTCMRGDCRQNADCGDGYRCASVDMGCGELQFLCQSAADECSGSADCEACGYDEPTEGVGVRVCGVQCGRPFLVAAQPRLPAPAARSDWSDASSPRVEHLSESERAALTAHWTKLGQMEHASIAAFARFSLQLLALGAPPELVEACTAALADETAHAKLCFGIASAYAGRAIGPGPLDVSNSLELTSLADIVDLVILEGCIGETSAALDALESTDSATDPVIRSAYARIADDEQRHAELAFRFVKWALERDPAAVLPRLQAALDVDTSRIGVEVVGPCLRALTSWSAAA